MKFVREYVYPVLIGLVPAIVGLLAAHVIIITWFVMKTSPVFVWLIGLFCLWMWAKFGYWYAEQGASWKHILLTHTIPAVACFITVVQCLLPDEIRSAPLRDFAMYLFLPVYGMAGTITAQFDTQPATEILSFLMLFFSFLAGGYLAWRKNSQGRNERCGEGER